MQLDMPVAKVDDFYFALGSELLQRAKEFVFMCADINIPKIATANQRAIAKTPMVARGSLQHAEYERSERGDSKKRQHRRYDSKSDRGEKIVHDDSLIIEPEDDTMIFAVNTVEHFD